MFYWIISTAYQKIEDLFCLVMFLDFRTVCSVKFQKLTGPKGPTKAKVQDFIWDFIVLGLYDFVYKLATFVHLHVAIKVAQIVQEKTSPTDAVKRYNHGNQFSPKQ